MCVECGEILSHFLSIFLHVIIFVLFIWEGGKAEGCCKAWSSINSQMAPSGLCFCYLVYISDVNLRLMSLLHLILSIT